MCCICLDKKAVAHNIKHAGDSAVHLLNDRGKLDLNLALSQYSLLRYRSSTTLINLTLNVLLHSEGRKIDYSIHVCTCLAV